MDGAPAFHFRVTLLNWTVAYAPFHKNSYLIASWSYQNSRVTNTGSAGQKCEQLSHRRIHEVVDTQQYGSVNLFWD